MLKVGDFIYFVDNMLSNKRCWKRFQVVNETKQSFIIDYHSREIKVNKISMLENQGKYSPRRWYSEQEKVDQEWLWENARRIADEVTRCKDIDKLKTIDSILSGDMLSI